LKGSSSHAILAAKVFSDSEEGGKMFHRNVSALLRDYIELHAATAVRTSPAARVAIKEHEVCRPVIVGANAAAHITDCPVTAPQRQFSEGAESP
jgi:hypothetical protein